jgi:hypothetical protein
MKKNGNGSGETPRSSPISCAIYTRKSTEEVSFPKTHRTVIIEVIYRPFARSEAL